MHFDLHDSSGTLIIAVDPRSRAKETRPHATPFTINVICGQWARAEQRNFLEVIDIRDVVARREFDRRVSAISDDIVPR
jgi:hypothetical protein